ncbi:pyrroline-5-carboxylate reductase dimerization-domain-containing protein [Cladochytrium replicatum]|nr:pyrroline-5-carboxylate reductase dimerization-domain-containing protein [Cladochytrium replicatum]
MGRAIIGGLLSRGFPSSNIIVSEPFPAAAESLKSDFNVHIAADNSAAVAFALSGASPSGADVVILAVKPQVMRGVVDGIKDAVAQYKPLMLSIAAGIRGVDLIQWLGGSPAVIRTMPNTPALVNEGATGLFAFEGVSQKQKDIAFGIMKAVSMQTEWVQREELLDVVTGVSGSGPAYFFLLMEGLQEAAVELGMSRATAKALVAQTCLGAGRMAVSTGEDFRELRRKVTSPKGTTEAGIAAMESANAVDIFKRAVVAATKRSEELGVIFGQQ